MRRARGVGEAMIERSLLGCALLSIITSAAILVILVRRSGEFFVDVSLGAFFFDTQWTPLFADAHFGIWPLLAGTFLTSAIAIAVALPFGLLAAIYLGEFAAPRVRAVLKPTLELLAGVPTIVYGYFALVTLTPLLQRILPDLAGYNALSPGLGTPAYRTMFVVGAALFAITFAANLASQRLARRLRDR